MLNTNSNPCATLCAHCGLPLLPNQQTFCCQGCRVVYSILQMRGLSQYYDIKRKGVSIREALPASEVTESYVYLDDPEFLKLYRVHGDDSPTMQFYLEGVHCAACVWLVEQVAEFLTDVQTVRLDLGKSVATVKLTPSGKFSEVAREFHNLGYRPHPVKNGEIDQFQKIESRRFLIRTGIAGACAGNIMLLAISLYSGADGEMAFWFRWLSFLFFLPALLYSATPFYRNAWAALKTKTVSIDIPVVLGIFIGTVASIFNLFGSEPIYFDSLASLIFLLLASRYVLHRTQQAALNSSSLMHFLTPSAVRKKISSGGPNSAQQIPDLSESSSPTAENYFKETCIEFLIPGDIVEVRVGESIPVDGRIVHGSSTLNCALLTGESEWVPVAPGDRVFAGTVNQQTPIEIEVSASGATTRLGQILKATEDGLTRKAPIVALTDRLSRIFILGTISLAIVMFFGGVHAFGNWHEGLNRALAIVIVTCPCALALATPLAMSVALGRLSRMGLLVKGADVLEKLSLIQTVFLDKTGTLTTGNFEVLHWEAQNYLDEFKTAIIVLESNSTHPIAKAMVRFFDDGTKPPSKVELTDFKEIIGKGVSGTIDANFYEITKSDASRSNVDSMPPGTAISVYRNGTEIGFVILGDRIRQDSANAINELRALDITPKILSGDSSSSVQSVGGQLGIPEADRIAQASPEHKSSIVGQTQNSLMVGDGANDAIALSAAMVGVAVHGGMEISLRAADVYISKPGVMPIVQILKMARETRVVVYRNLVFSLFYNALGIAFALSGYVGPLFAAVLMPLSALTVFISSLLGTTKQRRLSGSIK